MNFIYNTLDFRPSISLTYGGKITDSHALALLEHTTVSDDYLVNTDFEAVEQHANTSLGK